MEKFTLQKLVGHPRWKWVLFFALCEVITILGVGISVSSSTHYWVGGVSAAFFAPGLAVSVLQLIRPKPPLTTQNEFIVSRSRANSLAYLSLCIGWLIAANIIRLHRPEAAWLCYCFMFLCAFGCFVAVVKFFDRRPLIKVNESGVFEPSLSKHTIPWSEIKGASLESIKGIELITLHLKAPQKFVQNLSFLQRLAHRVSQITAVELMHLGVLKLDTAYSEQALDFILAHVGKTEKEDPFSALNELANRQVCHTAQSDS
ncbi:MAG: hypothetical protein K1X79_01770 [Oligoflexia bacterium]|nr:hypothetical protein [Oligoflexia bacterium]